MTRSVRSLLVAGAAVALLATSAAAQEMTTSDVQRLEQTADQIGDDIVNLRSRDRTAARTYEAELTELEDEITYLKVRFAVSVRCHARTMSTCATGSRIFATACPVTKGQRDATAPGTDPRRRHLEQCRLGPRSTFGCRQR